MQPHEPPRRLRLTYQAKSAQPGLLAKLVALAVGLVLMVAGLVFSLVIFAVILGAGLSAWSYFWWKTRALRQAMRQPPARGEAVVGEVIEGEAIVVDEPAPPAETSADPRRRG